MEAWTLNELEPSGAGEPRWSVGVNGPRAYLTTDAATAARIVACVNALAGLDPAAVAGVLAAFDALLDDADATGGRERVVYRVTVDAARAALAALRGGK